MPPPSLLLISVYSFPSPMNRIRLLHKLCSKILCVFSFCCLIKAEGSALLSFCSITCISEKCYCKNQSFMGSDINKNYYNNCFERLRLASNSGQIALL